MTNYRGPRSRGPLSHNQHTINTMKNTFKSYMLAILAIVTLLFPSCAYLDPVADAHMTPARMNRVASVVKSGTMIGSSMLLDKYPEYREGLMVAADALSAVVAGGDFEPVNVDKLIRKRLDDQLRDPVVAAVYTSVMDLIVVQYQVFWSENIDKFVQGNTQYVVQFLVAARDGINAALGEPVPTAATAPNPLKAATPTVLKL